GEIRGSGYGAGPRDGRIRIWRKSSTHSEFHRRSREIEEGRGGHQDIGTFRRECGRERSQFGRVDAERAGLADVWQYGEAVRQLHTDVRDPRRGQESGEHSRTEDADPFD